MKSKRNCPMAYGMPMMMPPMMMQPYNQMPTYTGQMNDNDTDIVNRLNNLEKRVSALENMYGTNNYNSSNYQML